MIETIPFNASEHFAADDAKLHLLNDALESGDVGYIAHAIGTIARAQGGIAWLANRTGKGRQALHRAFGESGNPTLETLMPVLQALGIRLRAERVEAASKELAEA